MVSGLSPGLGFTQTFVCTSSVATLTAAANNPPCFIFTFEGHSKHFVRMPSDSRLGLAGSCLLKSFLPRIEQCKMTTQAAARAAAVTKYRGFSLCSPLVSVKYVSGNHLRVHDNDFLLFLNVILIY